MALQQKRTPGKHIVFSVGIALVAFVAFALLGKETPNSDSLPSEKQAKRVVESSKPTANIANKTEQDSALNLNAPLAVNAPSIGSLEKPLPPDVEQAMKAPPAELPADLQAQLNAPPPELPEDLRRQLESPPQELPPDLKAQLEAPPIELPDDIKRALETPPRTVSIEEVNTPPQ